MSVDIEIYMSNIHKFFKENPNELYSLVPTTKEEEFFKRIRETAVSNHEKGDDVSLTRQQLINICLELNGTVHSVSNIDKLIIKTQFGEYSLN
jgi:hypothetical protein